MSVLTLAYQKPLDLFRQKFTMPIIADRYETIRELGRGSTGIVYLVRDIESSAEYALKLLNRVLSADQAFIEKFKREADAMRSFSHPGSIRVHDFGQTQDRLYYLTMDYSDGQLLEDILAQNGKLPVKQALEVMIQLLDILDAAHQAGVVHRDVKPENIMIEGLNSGGLTVRILDFGVAKHQIQLEHDLSTTLEGTVLGTPFYMSPEQASGDVVLDHRVDIYAAGILMYELLSGNLPFVGDTVVQTLLLHLMKPPPSFNLSLSIPSSVENIVLKALEKNRDFRFQTALDFKVACVNVMRDLNRSPNFNMSSAVARQLQNATIKESKPKSGISEEKQEEAKPKTTILCLDDDQMILNILTFLLEKAGYAVITTTESSMAHHYLFHEDIKLLVSDVQMPGLPGTKICKMLKESIKSLKIALFSNLPDRDLARMSKESMADGWISKNTKPEEWLAKIVELLGEPH